MNDNNKKSKKILLIIIFILVIAALGITFAYFAARVSVNGINGKSECLNIDYIKGQNIMGELTTGANYSTGANTSVTMSVNSSCNVNGAVGTIYLTTNDETTMDLTDNALKYAVKVGSNVVSQGTVNGNTNQVIYDNFNVTSTPTTYQVYIWLDEALEATTNINDETYSGFIHAKASVKSTVKSH